MMQGSVEVTGEGSSAPSASDAQAADTTSATTEQQQQTAATGETAVNIVDIAFEPATLDVPAGATVVWMNTGQAPHTVTGSFADSGTLSPGQTFSHTFAEAGALDYVCSFHPQMTSRVQVGAVAAGAAASDEPATSDRGELEAHQAENVLAGIDGP
jgi:plastocyanin